MAEEQENEDVKAEKKGPPKIILFIVGGMVLLSVVAFVAVRFMAGSAKEEVTEEEAAEAKDPTKVFTQLFSFEQALVVNLAETNGQRYLKVNLQLEMSKEELLDELTARAPQLLDLIISILSSKTIEDATTIVGRNRLKREIIDRINAELITGKVINIFFTEFVIQ